MKLLKLQNYSSHFVFFNKNTFANYKCSLSFRCWLAFEQRELLQRKGNSNFMNLL